MRSIGIIIFSLIFGFSIVSSQPSNVTGTAESGTVISKISVLSIHVREAAVHDSVFHFLTDKLGLPVEYYPVKYEDRWYASVYTGNMFLEPCGPFVDFEYASNNFKAIFFGINCESERSASSIAEDLTSRNIGIKQTDAVQVVDSTFIRQNIYLNIASGIRSDVKPADSSHEDSLRREMFRVNKNPLGIETIKEIRVGYPGTTAFTKWQEFMKPALITPEGIWKINEDQSIRFEKSRICEVKGIVFEVKSLGKAKAWLIENHLVGNIRIDEIEMDKSKTFGLSMWFRE